MDITKLAKTFHPLERKVLSVIGKATSLQTIVESTKLKSIEVMRALQWLQNKKVVIINKKSEEVVSLSDNGNRYKKIGMPETRFLDTIKDGQSMGTREIGTNANLNAQEIGVSIGILKKKLAIKMVKDGGSLKINITQQGNKILKSQNLEENFLNKVFPIKVKDLNDQEKFTYDTLIKRKQILSKDEVKQVSIEVTNLGKQLLKKGISKQSTIDRLDSEMLTSGSWKTKSFRAYDVSINVPKIHGGRRHFVKEIIEYVKRIWLDLGFKEMTGDMVQTSFWNFDALFTAQDHPVREMQDTFFIANPLEGKLPNKKLVRSVQDTHETGSNTGSLGWQYKWDPSIALKNVLRTHTTVLSAKTLANLQKDQLPAKFFSVGKVFRNETLDWKHLFEFYQTDCIVVDPDANFSHLIGYLKEFFKKMGYPKVRIRPAYFPYTEPSAEVDVFHPVHKEWIELGGSGVFRPEVVTPLLGEDIPVLAWGLGLERIVTEYYSINDLRQIYSNDIKQLRNIKAWLR